LSKCIFLKSFVICGLLVLTACAPGNAARKPTASSSEIAIAAVGPMQGPLAVFGEQMRMGAQAAVIDINAKGGVLGKPLRLAVEDDGCRSEKAVSAADNVVDQGAVFVVGHFCSGASIPASEVYRKAGVLQITPSSTNPVLTAKGNPTVFRVTNNDKAQGTFAGAWLAKNYAGKNLAVIDNEQPYGRDVAGEAARSAEAGGLKPVLLGSFHRGTTNFSDLIARLKAARIDVVFVGGYHDEVGPFLKQAREQGFDGDFASDDALNTLEFTKFAGRAADGLRFTDAVGKTDLASSREVVGKFRSGVYRLNPARYEPEGYTLNAYAAVQVFAAAAAGTGSTDARKMADWLRANHVETVIGDLSWDTKGDLKELYYAWFVWQGDSFRQEP
jgi:branched-chain amino acid transport system substrate-binding protein